VELSTELMEQIWQRQNGMCGFSGKKFEELPNVDDVHYLKLSPRTGESEDANPDFVMLWKQCDLFMQYDFNELEIHPPRRFLFPYAEFDSYEYQDMLSDISEEIELLISSVAEAKDLNEVQNKLRDMLQVIKNINLEPQDRSLLSEKINSGFDKIKERRDEEKRIFEEKYDEIYAKFKESVLEQIKFSQDTEIINKGRDALIEVQNKFKEMNLKRDHREEIVKMLDEAFDNLNQRQAEERERYEMECIENYHNLKAIVDDALEFFQNSDNLRDVRLKLIEAQNSFKGLVLKKEQREEQFDRVQKAFDILNEKQAAERAEFEKEAEENYSKLKVVIDEAIEFSKTAEIFKDARQKLIKAQKEIRGKKLRKIQRDNLYGAIREAFEALNERQDEYREEFEKEAEENYQMLRKNIDGAIAYALNTENYNEARETLIKAQNAIKGMRLKKEQMDNLFSSIRETFNEVNRKQDEDRDDFVKECNENYAQLKNKLAKTDTELDGNNIIYKDYREKLIALQNEIKIVKLKRDQRNELFQKMRHVFNKFDEKRDAFFDNVKENKKDKLESVKENLNRKIDRIKDSLSWDQKSLDFQQSKFKDPSVELTDDDKKEVDEKIAFINGVIQDKLDSIKEVEDRIAEIDKEISEIAEELNDKEDSKEEETQEEATITVEKSEEENTELKEEVEEKTQEDATVTEKKSEEENTELKEEAINNDEEVEEKTQEDATATEEKSEEENTELMEDTIINDEDVEEKTQEEAPATEEKENTDEATQAIDDTNKDQSLQ
jgi:hypothetical protein